MSFWLENFCGRRQAYSSTFGFGCSNSMLSPVELADGLDAMGELVEERIRSVMWHGFG